VNSENFKLLVVDDDKFNRDLLARHLKKEGYTKVEFAESGRKALEVLESKEIDLVLLDIEMPDTDGVTVLKTLKNDPRKRNIPVIMISGVEEFDTVVECIGLGAEDYLAKPFNSVLLRARISASLEKKGLRDQEIRLKEQADQLLQAILPYQIAEELKTTGKVQPKHHEEVSVLMADIVGFTPYCESHSPETVIADLQAISDCFETITEKHDLEKINAVGDSFMAVAGLVSYQSNPVLQCVNCGLELHSALENLPSGLKLRIGIHVGPVVAGVVGHKKFLYGLFGNTVNTAARMENNGRPGIVCLSADAWKRVSSVFRGESQGQVQIKGKGKMEIFFVEGEKE